MKENLVENWTLLTILLRPSPPLRGTAVIQDLLYFQHCKDACETMSFLTLAHTESLCSSLIPHYSCSFCHVIVSKRSENRVLAWTFDPVLHKRELTWSEMWELISSNTKVFERPSVEDVMGWVIPPDDDFLRFPPCVVTLSNLAGCFILKQEVTSGPICCRHK